VSQGNGGAWTWGLHRVSGSGIVFWALSYGEYSTRYFKELKADVLQSNCWERLKTDKLAEASIRCAAAHVKKGGFDVLTVPPHSGEGVSFAARVGALVAERAGVRFKVLFRDHGAGKRKHVSTHLSSKIGFEFNGPVDERRILVFDDIAYTRRTMTGTIGAFRSAGIDAEGLVLCRTGGD